MHVDTLFPSKHLSAADLDGKDLSLTVESWQIEEVGTDEEERPVLYFREHKKGMVLNRTNADSIAGLYGTEVDQWIGKTIIVYPTTTRFGKKTVPCIRVRETKVSAQKGTETAAVSPIDLSKLTPEMLAALQQLMGTSAKP